MDTLFFEILTISLFRKPGILREQEFDIITMTTKTPTVSDTPKTVSKGSKLTLLLYLTLGVLSLFCIM